MLRVGLTGDLGSGKSTIAAMLAARGAKVFSSDEMARAMMSPGEKVYRQIVAHFGPDVLAADQTLDRRKLAALAFDPAHPRIAELNAIVHPAVIAAQAEQFAALAKTHTIAVVESALLFSARASADQKPWNERFDRILLVTATEHDKIARFVERVAQGRKLSSAERSAAEADAKRRLRVQHQTAEHAAECLVLHNDGSLAELEPQVEAAWHELVQLERATWQGAPLL
jgi:dephospho-CoA kinase